MSWPFVHAFHDLGPAKGPRLAMCWHMAEGGGTVSYLAKANPNGVSVHFVVENTGRVVQMLALDHMHSSIRTSDIRTTDDKPYEFQGETVTYGRTAAVAALGDWASTAKTLGPNHATIGVEVEGFAANGPNALQTAAIAALAKDLGLPAHLGHRDFASYKGCPGRRFPWPSVGGHGQQQEDSDVRFTNANGNAVTSNKRLPVVAGDKWTYLDGKPGGTIPAPAELVVLGTIDSQPNEYLVLLPTETPYPNDPIVRDTLVRIPTTRALVGAPATDCSNAVAAQREKDRTASLAAIEEVFAA